MNRYQVCIPRILKHEGGYVNHPRDPGGATNRGITLATYRRYIKRSGTVADLKALTEAEAVKVYKAQYWDAVKADQLPVGVDYTVADFAVNSGPARAAKHLQKAIGVKQDGKIGPATLAAVASRDPAQIVHAIHDSRMAFLRGLKTWGTFGRGWTRRVSEVQSSSLADILNAGPMATTQRPNTKPVSLDQKAFNRGVETVLSPRKSGLAALIAAILSLFKRK